MRLENKKTLLLRHIITLLHCYIVTFFITSCAVISSPTGGERDTAPPKILAENPVNKTINFKAKEIDIAFDEFIQLQNPQNIIITPDINPKPVFTSNRKSLNIKFKTALDTNTTYSIFFGNELKDYNEGNPTENYTYVFSTGDYIDSISVKGNIQNYSDKLPQNTFVILYKDLNDSLFTTKRPNYISRVQSDGSFQLNNLKQGQYQMFVLSDNNNNYYYDLPTELIGFLDQPIQIDSNINNIVLPLFLPDEPNLRIVEKDKSVKNGLFNITWNNTLSPKTDQVEIKTESNEIKAIPFADEKSMRIYFTNLKSDTGNIQFFVKHNGKIIDSVFTKITQQKLPTPFFDTIQYKNIKILQSNPVFLVSDFISVSNIDTSKIYITDTSENKIPFTVLQDEDLKTYQLKGNFSPQAYTIFILDSCIQDLAGNFNAAQKISLLVDEDKKGGNLLINIKLDTIYPDLIFLFKDNQGKILKKEILSNSQAFKINIGLIQAGEYKVEIIRDDNQNEIWNSGSFSTKTLPEKIYKHATSILIKENWDSEETIQPDFNQTKKTEISKPNSEKENELMKNLQDAPNQNFQNRNR